MYIPGLSFDYTWLGCHRRGDRVEIEGCLQFLIMRTIFLRFTKLASFSSHLITLKYDVSIQAAKDRPWFLPLLKILFVADVLPSIPPEINEVRFLSCGVYPRAIAYAPSKPQSFCKVHRDHRPILVMDPCPYALLKSVEIHCPKSALSSPSRAIMLPPCFPRSSHLLTS